jgi:hypothetical protein
MSKQYSKFLPSTVVLKISFLVILVTFAVYNNDSYHTGPPKVVLRNFNSQAGFHYNIYCINHALYACEQSKRELVVLFDSGLYKEDRPQFVVDNPYYNQYDWLSYYFEPINQTDKPLRYWKKWVTRHPLARSISSAELKQPVPEHTDSPTRKYKARVFDSSSIDTSLNVEHRAKEFHRIWHKYFKLRPHIQKIVDDFKHKHDFANKYVIALHYRGTDKYDHKQGSEDGPEHPPYEFCAALVKKIIKNSRKPLSDVVTFIATDEQPFVNYMKTAGVNAVFIDAIRSDTSTSSLSMDFSQCTQGVIDSTPESKIYNELITQSVHRGMPDKSNYTKGCDVLVDAILLGSSNTLIRSRGNVSNQAFWIGGPAIESMDLVDEFNAYKKKSESGNDWRAIYDDL